MSTWSRFAKRHRLGVNGCVAAWILAVIAIPGAASAQSDRVSWKRSGAALEPKTVVFHSTHVINLPTAETYQRGMFQFELSHRFVNAMSTGYDTFYGMDGPANIRLGLGYAVTDDVTLTLARSNLRGNVELLFKWSMFRPRSAGLPVHLGMVLGGGWDTNSPLQDASSHRSFQYFAQFVANTRIGRSLALGVVPSYLYNSIPESEDVEHALTLGLYGQYYLSSLMSLMLEWNVIEPGYYVKYDAFAWGIELETGGHSFKLVFTNSTHLNTPQYLPGTVDSAAPREWRFGFNITRLLKF